MEHPPLNSMPDSVTELLEALDQAIPRASVLSPVCSAEEIAKLNFAAGQRDLVDRLIALADRSRQHVL